MDENMLFKLYNSDQTDLYEWAEKKLDNFCDEQ